MRKNHFFFGYAGNKRAECVKIYDEFKAIQQQENKIDTIYEPYCGTCAFSCYLSMQEPLRYKYILNDNNIHLIELYNIAKDEEKLNQLCLRLNALIVDIDKVKYNKMKENDTLETYIIMNSIMNIRPGLFPSDVKRTKRDYNAMKNVAIINFLRTENITFTNTTVKKIEDEYNKPNIFSFIDPPYLTECNDFYRDKDVNIFEYFFNNKLSSFDTKILIIVSDVWLMKLLFKDYIKKSYPKLYQSSKKSVNHLIIGNYL